jgi:hypothetical protein
MLAVTPRTAGGAENELGEHVQRRDHRPARIEAHSIRAMQRTHGCVEQRVPRAPPPNLSIG